MTTSFSLDGIALVVSGIKHHEGFDVHSVKIAGYARDVKAILSADFLERIAEAAASITDDPFEEQKPAPTVTVLDVKAKRLVELSVELVDSPTLREVNARRGHSDGVGEWRGPEVTP
jgi:hypothetical protein